MAKAQYTSIRKGLGDIPNPIQGLKVELFGEWKKLDRVMNYFTTKSGVKRDLAKAQRDFLTRYKRELVKGLLSEGASTGKPFDPHQKSYYSKTGQIGQRDGLYLKALEGAIIKQKNYGVSLYLPQGILRMRSKDTGMTVGQYVYTFEFGRKGGHPQVARPLFRPAYNKLGGPKGVLKQVRGGIGKRLNQMGVRIKL